MSLLFLFVVGTAGSFALGAAPQQSSSITVSAAISLKDALDELGPIFQVQQHRKDGGSGTAVTYNYGGSGTLARQIEQGAPVDVFFSAAEKQMDELAAQGLIVADTRRDLVGNALVLIVPSQATPVVHNFQDLTGSAVKTIALGETSTVPAGMYARQTLEHLGLFAAVEKKIVYAKDVRAVLTYVETGNADAGLVYQTDANTSTKVRVSRCSACGFARSDSVSRGGVARRKRQRPRRAHSWNFCKDPTRARSSRNTALPPPKNQP